MNAKNEIALCSIINEQYEDGKLQFEALAEIIEIFLEHWDVLKQEDEEQ
jgi:hypothetical protein